MKTLSNSFIDLYRSCPAKFKKQVIDGRVPVEPPSVPMEYGSALHLGIEAYLTGENGHKVFDIMLRASPAFAKESDLQRHLSMGEIHLNKFKKLHMKHFTQVSSEQRLFTKLLDFSLAGTPDAVCLYKGVPSIVDFKTSYAVYDKQSIRSMPQMKMYALMLRELGIKVEQLVYMVFTKSGEFSIQVLTKGITDEEIDAFRSDLLLELGDISNDTCFRKNPKACFDFGRACPYLDECFPQAGGSKD